jgi:hypothetical protein
LYDSANIAIITQLIDKVAFWLNLDVQFGLQP